MYEPPDDRALTAYLARARHHSSTIELANETIAGLQGHSDRGELVARSLALREQAQQALRVMQALAAAWDRDQAARQARRDQWEREIQQRFSRYGRWAPIFLARAPGGQ